MNDIDDFLNALKSLKKNRKLSKKYGLHIYNSQNPQFPYWVQEWDECFTEEEIAMHCKDHWMIENL